MTVVPAQSLIVTTSPAGAVAKYCDEYVCMCVWVCLSVREDISGTTSEIFYQIFVHVAYGRGSVLRRRYVLPVLWMTSCFLSIMGHIAV